MRDKCARRFCSIEHKNHLYNYDGSCFLLAVLELLCRISYCRKIRTKIGGILLRSYHLITYHSSVHKEELNKSGRIKRCVSECAHFGDDDNIAWCYSVMNETNYIRQKMGLALDAGGNTFNTICWMFKELNIPTISYRIYINGQLHFFINHFIIVRNKSLKMEVIKRFRNMLI